MTIGYVCLIDIDKTHLENKNYKIIISYENDINDIYNSNELNCDLIFLISCFQPNNIKRLIYNELCIYIELQNDYEYFTGDINIIKNIFYKFIQNNTTSSGLNIITKITKKELEYVSNILSIVSTKRIMNTSSWQQIGNCLYNIHNCDDTLLQKWIEISNIEYNNIDLKCCNLWDNYVYNGYNIETLIDWVKEDNKITYESIHNQYIFNLIKDYIEQNKLNDYHLVEMFHQIYKHQYMNVKKNGNYIWYEYKYRRWIRMRNLGIIRNKLSNEFNMFFENQIKYFNNEINIVDNIHFNKIQIIISNIKKVCKRLTNTNKKKILISKCKLKFQISYEEFELYLNVINNIANM
jgi:hypothetical protein